MLYSIAAACIIIWIAGIVSLNTMGGFIHLFLVLAIMVVMMKIVGKEKQAFYLTGVHLENSSKHLTVSNGVAFALLSFGCLSMILGIKEMNSSEFILEKTIVMFAAGIVGSSIGLIGLLRTSKK